MGHSLVKYGHRCLLVVRTTCGDFFILDKRRNTLIPWYKTGYTCIKRGGEAPFVMSGKSATLLR